MSRLVKYSQEFKLDALNLLQEDKSLSEISKSLGISYMVIRLFRVWGFTFPRMSRGRTSTLNSLKELSSC